MKHTKHLLVLWAALLLGAGNAWGATFSQTYTLSNSDNGQNKATGDVTWAIGTNAITKDRNNMKLTGTITVTLPAGATLTSVEITKSNTWGSGATVVFASETTTLNTFSNSGSFTLTKNKTDLVYTFTKSGTNSKNAWVKTIKVTYESGSTGTTVYLGLFLAAFVAVRACVRRVECLYATFHHIIMSKIDFRSVHFAKALFVSFLGFVLFLSIKCRFLSFFWANMCKSASLRWCA